METKSDSRKSSSIDQLFKNYIRSNSKSARHLVARLFGVDEVDEHWELSDVTTKSELNHNTVGETPPDVNEKRMDVLFVKSGNYLHIEEQTVFDPCMAIRCWQYDNAVASEHARRVREPHVIELPRTCILTIDSCTTPGI